MKFKEGDRVNHFYLGKGTFLEETGFLSLVLWDKSPDFKYNMGKNPFSVPTNKIKKVTEDEKMKNLTGEFDAAVWAKEFVKLVKNKPEIATDEETMSGWFANAIMAGHDRAKQNMEKVKGKNIIERNKKLVVGEIMGRITGTVKSYRQILELGDYKEGDIAELLTRLEQILKDWKKERAKNEDKRY